MNEWWLRKDPTMCFVCGTRPRVAGRNVCAVHAADVTPHCATVGCANVTTLDRLYCTRCRGKS